MSKKNDKKNQDIKNNCMSQDIKNDDHKNHCGHHCTGCHSKRPGLFDGVTLHIEHLDIHMDERMYSCNHYCGCGAAGDGTEVDMEKLVEKVAAYTGVDKDTVIKVILAEDVYLQEQGVSEVIPEEEDTQTDEEQIADEQTAVEEDQVSEKQTSEEQTADEEEAVESEAEDE